MKNCIIIFLFLCTLNCAKSVRFIDNEKYISVCVLNGHPSVILTLYEDKKFTYEFAYVDTLVTGQWEVLNGKILLSSEDFTSQKGEPQSLTPSKKYTEYSNEQDAFCLKRKKLYRIDSSGRLDKNCFLKRLEK